MHLWFQKIRNTIVSKTAPPLRFVFLDLNINDGMLFPEFLSTCICIYRCHFTIGIIQVKV